MTKAGETDIAKQSADEVSHYEVVSINDGTVEKELFEEGSLNDATDTPLRPWDLRIDTKNGSVEQIVNRIREGAMDLEPDFQRGSDIWNKKTQSRLIESLLIGIPLPAFYFDATQHNNWLVVDGQQRLSAIKKFIIDKTLRLEDLEFLTDLNGKVFDDLSSEDQRNIREAELVWYLIMPGTPPEVKFRLFKRINTGGQPLNPQEIRHTLNQGSVTAFIKELAQSAQFISATCQGVSPRRMDDRDCVTRFLVFTFKGYENYAKDDLDGFLNSGMAELNNLKVRYEELRDAFYRAMDLASQIFGQHAFRKIYSADQPRNQVNKALFECWSVCLGALDDHQAQCLVQQREQVVRELMYYLNNDAEFESSVSVSTGAVRKVKKRFEVTRTIIEQILGDSKHA